MSPGIRREWRVEAPRAILPIAATHTSHALTEVDSPTSVECISRQFHRIFDTRRRWSWLTSTPPVVEPDVRWYAERIFRPLPANTHNNKHVSAFDFANSIMIPNATIRHSSFKQEFLHLSALNAFALAQPLLDRLAANTLFLKGCDYSGTAVLVSIGLILTIIPVGVLLTTAVLRWRGWSRSANVVLGVATGLLSAMSLLILTRWMSDALNLMSAGIPDGVLGIFALCGGLAAARLYFWSGRFRQILSLCAVGIILFPLSFFSKAAIREHVLGMSVQQERVPGTARNPAPVIMVVFDGLCGMALLNEYHEVDRIRYPSFARLADTSSF